MSSNLHFSCASAALVRELGLLSGAVERRTTIPILANVKMEANGSGKLHLTATDLELSITTAVDAEIHASGAHTLPAKRLIDYLKLLPSMIGMKVADTGHVAITAGKSRARIPGLSSESFPELPPMPEVSASLKAMDLAGLIKRTQHAICAEESRFTLNGALMVFGETTRMVATDGHRLAFVEIPVDAGERSRILVPRRALAEVIRLAEKGEAGALCEFATDDSHLFFRIGDRLIAARKLTGNFPDYERVLPKQRAGKAIIDAGAAVEALRRVRLTADERSHAIRLHITDGMLRITSQMVEAGESAEELAAEISGPDLELALNCDYLVDALQSCGTPKAAIHYGKSGEALVVTAADSDGLSGTRFILMPMRI
jgi:DNA polymerase-3 subunit beta